MEHHQRSVLKDINGQVKMNPLQTRDFNSIHKKASDFRRDVDQTICEDSDSSSSDDYRSAEEEDEAFNKELESMIRGISSVHILTPKVKKLKTQLQRSFSLNKTIDLNLSQQLVKEIENIKEKQDKENQCTDTHNLSYVENDEKFASLLDQTENESAINTTVKLAKTPSKTVPVILKDAVEGAASEDVVTNITPVVKSKNESEEISNISPVVQSDTNAKIVDDPNNLTEHYTKEETKIVQHEQSTSLDKIEPCKNINKSDSTEKHYMSQNEETDKPTFKVDEFIATSSGNIQNSGSESTILNTTFENIPRNDTNIIPEPPKPEAQTINKNLPGIEAEPALNTTFENISQDSKMALNSPKPVIEIKKDKDLHGTAPNLNTTFESNPSDSQIIAKSPQPNAEISDNNLPGTRPFLNTTFENISAGEINIDKDFPGTEPILNKTLEIHKPDNDLILNEYLQKDEKAALQFTDCNTYPVPNVKQHEDLFNIISNKNEENAIQDGILISTQANTSLETLQTICPMSYEHAIDNSIPGQIKPAQYLVSQPDIQPEPLNIMKDFDIGNLQGNQESSEIVVEDKSDLNHTTVICDAEEVQVINLNTNNIIKPDLVMIDKFADSTIAEGNTSFNQNICHKIEEKVLNNIPDGIPNFEQSAINDITITESEKQPDILSNLDSTVIISDIEKNDFDSDENIKQKLEISNTIPVTGRLSDIFKSDLVMNKFANSTFAEEMKLNDTLTIDQSFVNNITITEIKPKKFDELQITSDIIPALNQTITNIHTVSKDKYSNSENNKQETESALDTTITHKELNAEKNLASALNETYDFGDKIFTKNINNTYDKPEEFELTKLVKAPAKLDRTVILNDLVSHKDIGSSNIEKIENRNCLLNTTNNFQTCHKMPNDFQDFASATKSSLQSTIIQENPEQDGFKNLSQFIENDVFNGTFNINDQAPLKCNLSKNTLKMFDNFDTRSFSNEGADVDLLCKTLDTIDLNNTQIDLHAKQSKDITQDNLCIFDNSNKEIKEKNLLEDSFMKFDESDSGLIPKLALTNEDVKTNNSNDIQISSPMSANSLLLGSPISQNSDQNSDKQSDRSESPKSTSSIFKWIGQFLSPGKLLTGGHTDNLKEASEEQIDVKDKSVGQIKSNLSKSSARLENDFVSLGDETPLPDFMSVSTTSEINESRTNNDEQIELHNELNKLRQLVSQNEDKLKDVKQQIDTYRNNNDEIQQRIEKHEKDLAKKVENEKVIEITVTNFEKRVKELTIENEVVVRENNAKLHKYKKDRDSASNHLSSLEGAFSNLHKKYELCKNVIEQMKTNQEVMKFTNDNLRSSISEQTTASETLDEHVQTQMKSAKSDIKTHEQKHKVEMVKWNALIKKAELQKTSIEDALIKKQEENKELMDLCDVLIQKVA